MQMVHAVPAVALATAGPSESTSDLLVIPVFEQDDERLAGRLVPGDDRLALRQPERITGDQQAWFAR